MFQTQIRLLIVLAIVAGFSANHCKIDVTSEHHLLNKGFHRNITYHLSFAEDLNHQYENCIVGLNQALPPGVYANPDELGDLRRGKKLSAIPLSRVNIELPAEESQYTNVFIITQLSRGTARAWLPVHARYHHATAEEGYARNFIGSPKVYLRCPDSRLDQCDNIAPSMTFLCNASSQTKCIWREIPTTALTDALTLDVPVGKTTDYYLVTSVTACVIIAGSLYLLKTLHLYKISIARNVL